MKHLHKTVKYSDVFIIFITWRMSENEMYSPAAIVNW